MASANIATSWAALLRSAMEAHKHIRTSSFIQLATVCDKGLPHVRTVVFREFYPETDNIVIVTTSRTQKMKELAHQPHAEIHWYFTESREQFRLLGTVSEVKDASYRESIWAKLSENNKRWTIGANENDNVDLGTVSPDLRVLVHKPYHVDHVDLRQNTRTIFDLKEDSWSSTCSQP